MENMSILKVAKQVKGRNHTYSVMKSDTRVYVHINNTKTNDDSVIVPLEELSKLFE